MVSPKVSEALKERVNTYFPAQNKEVIHKNDLLFPSLWIKRNPIKKMGVTHPEKNIWAIEPQRIAANELIQSIDRAQNVVCLCSFILSDPSVINAILRASERGVRVYALTTTKEFNQKLSEMDPDYKKERYNKHIEMLNTLAGRVLLRLAEFFHAKFLLVDPQDQNSSQGFISTANFTEEALSDRVELVKRLSKSQIQDCFTIFKSAFWSAAQYEIFEPERAENAQKFPQMQPPSLAASKDFLWTLKETCVLRDYLTSYLTTDAGDLFIAAYGFDLNHTLIENIGTLLDKGRNICIFTRLRETQIEVLTKLRKRGAKILGHEGEHAKFVIPVKKTAPGCMFTANFTTLGMDGGFEIGVLLDPSESDGLREICSDWQKNFPYEFQTDTNIAVLRNKQEIRILNSENFEDFIIEDEKVQDLGVLTVRDLRELKEYNLESQNFPFTVNRTIYKQVRVKAQLIAPIMPPNAVEVETRKNIPIFKLNKKNFVGVQKPSEIPAALDIAKQFNAQIVFWDHSIRKLKN